MGTQNLLAKTFVVTLLTVLLLVPLAMIRGQVSDRAEYRQEALQSVSAGWTGAQRVAGPLLIVPYRVRVVERNWNSETKRYEQEERLEDRQLAVSPAVLNASVDVEVERRQRGIHSVPVYTSEHRMSGRFDLEAVRTLSRTQGFTGMDEPFIAMHIGDARGIATEPRLKVNGEEVRLAPGSRLGGIGQGVHAPIRLPGDSASSMNFDLDLQIRGTTTLAFVPVGKTTTVELRSPWPHPRFSGRYLPRSHRISAEGFEADWHLNQFATNLESALANCTTHDCEALKSNVFDVALVDPVDIYLKAERSTKYGILFVAVTFIAFLLTEVLKGLRIHPVQYLLVGLGLSIFFLLLLALSEHIGFGLAYLGAAGACILLLSYYVGFVLKRARGALPFAAGLSALFGALYVTLLSEDYALLMGSGLLFVVLATVIVLTRRIDWYTVSTPGVSGRQASSL